MNNKIYYHNLQNTETVELGWCKGKTELDIYHDGGISKVLLNKTNFTVFGNDLPSLIKVYYDESNDYYHIIKTSSTSSNKYIVIESVSDGALGSGIISGKAKAIDLTNLTLCVQTNIEKKEPINIVEYYKNANETMEYISINSNTSQYQVMSSLIVMNARTTSGTYIANIYHMYKRNGNGNTDLYTIEKITGTGTESNFNVTPTKTGFTCVNTSDTKYKITEISTTIQ